MTEDWRADLHRDLAAGRRRSKRISPYDTGAWKARRTELKHDAYCVLCARFRLHTPAKIADHIVPVADGGAFEGELQPLCLDCHKIKRVIENAWRKGKLGIAELDLSVGHQALRLRAAAFGVGVDGFQLVRVD